jgi:hypothetical protein
MQAAADARTASQPHTITYVDFLTVTLTAMCVLLAALGFIVAVVAIVGYNDIKRAAAKAGRRAVRVSIEATLKEYPDAATLHARYSAVDRYMTEMIRKEALLAKVRGGSNPVANASNEAQDKRIVAKRPRKYPKTGE